jgi:hypothetical protein
MEPLVQPLELPEPLGLPELPQLDYKVVYQVNNWKI